MAKKTSEQKTWEEKNFTEKLWTFDEKVLIQQFIVARGKGDPNTAMAILEAKAGIAAAQTAKATRLLAIATLLLALFTAALVAVEVLGIHVGSEPSHPTSTVTPWPTGTASTSATTPSTGSKSSTSPGH